MSDCKIENTCETKTPKQSDCCTLAEDMICLAKQAKKDLLKEKMKAVYEAKIGEKMNNVAEIAVTAALECMMQQLASKEACENYKNDLIAAIKS